MVVTRGNNANNPNPNINVQLDGAALDTFIPKIPKADHGTELMTPKQASKANSRA